MSRADRAFAAVVLVSLALGGLALVPLLLTLFPGEIGAGSRQVGGAINICAAAIYHLGEALPPLGAITVALLGGAVFAATRRLVRLVLGTARLEAARPSAPIPADIAAAAERVGISATVRCYISAIPDAYTAGFLSPRIWAASSLGGLLGPAELEAVLLHERAHLRRRDPLRVLIVRTLEALLALVPAVGTLARRFDLAKELDADREALLVQRTPHALAGALAALADHADRDRGGLAIGAWSLSSARIDQLCGLQPDTYALRPSRRASLVSVLTCALVLFLGGGQAARANVLPGSVIAGLGFAADDTGLAHVCPLPTRGILF